MAKIALLGAGKTGGRVLEVETKHTIEKFDENNPPSLEKLKNFDGAISFLPGPALLGYIDMIIEAKLHLASGSTGMEWPDDIDSRLKDARLSWISASNFAIGMNLVKAMIKSLGKAPEIFEDYTYTLHEIHHKDKKDAPSGTALSWQNWLGQSVKFEDERIGDTVGDHKLTLDTEYESMVVQHIAKDRKIFAKGALYTMDMLVNGEVETGFHQLSDIMASKLKLNNQ